MALRPTELQIILTATRDIERVQQLQQQQPRSQQEYLALQFAQEVEARKRQAQAAPKTEQGEIRKLDSEGKGERQARKRRRQAEEQTKEQKEPPRGQHIIDLLI